MITRYKAKVSMCVCVSSKINTCRNKLLNFSSSNTDLYDIYKLIKTTVINLAVTNHGTFTLFWNIWSALLWRDNRRLHDNKNIKINVVRACAKFMHESNNSLPPHC